MTQETYSYDEVWLLLYNIPLMDYARNAETQLWRQFKDAVSNQTAQGYPNNWNTSFLINKMAEDLGSYKSLLDIWFQVEEVLDNTITPLHRDWIESQL